MSVELRTKVSSKLVHGPKLGSALGSVSRDRLDEPIRRLRVILDRIYRCHYAAHAARAQDQSPHGICLISRMQRPVLCQRFPKIDAPIFSKLSACVISLYCSGIRTTFCRQVQGCVGRPWVLFKRDRWKLLG